MSNSKRLGRYHNIFNSNNNNNSASQSYFNELASMYRENNKKSVLDWNKPLFEHKHTSLEKVLANANKATERATKFLNKIKSRQLSCINRVKSIPENATIRKEYIKCGKEICQHEHGPYFYAYWKDPESKKLKKKYIGDRKPENKELNNGCNKMRR